MTEPAVHHVTGRDGLPLAWRESGVGRPLVLFHGFTGSGMGWLQHGHAAAIAAGGRRVILPDLRGHGESARGHDPAGYPPDILADDGLALVEQLGLDDYDLGGYSLGGRVALRMLVRGARPGRAVVAGQGMGSVSRAAGSTTNRRLLTALVHGEQFEPGSADAQAAHWLTAFGGDPRALLLVLDSLVATSATDLRTVDTPTLVVVGEDDAGQAGGDTLAAALANGRFEQVPGTHWDAFASVELATTIAAFLAG